MDYFVSIENTMYYHWQISLLIKSFESIKDKLCIAITDTQPKISLPPILEKHKRKFFHNDYGKERYYEKFNTIISLMGALDEGVISTPFTLIHPDMVLVSPVEEFEEDIVFSLEISKETDELKGRLKSVIDTIRNYLQIPEDTLPWLPLGDVITFNKVPDNFFHRVLENMETLFKQTEKEMILYGSQWNIYKAALIITIYEFLPKLKLKPGIKEGYLINSDLNFNFLHYKHGLPSVFHKRYFTYNSTLSMASTGPYQTLLDNRSTQAVDYMCKIIENIKKEIRT